MSDELEAMRMSLWIRHPHRRTDSSLIAPNSSLIYMNRRTLLKTAGLLPLVAAPDLLVAPSNPLRKRSVRFAYIGDTHITADKTPMEGVARCLHHAQNQADKPRFILHGGDTIMDALVLDRAVVQKQWNAWNTVMKADNSLPIEHCIGNHDVWGLDSAKNDLLYGKKWAVEQMRISGRYRSFDQNDWHFIVLDSVQPTPEGRWYTANIDPEQMNWLKADLAKTDPKTPVLILSHIPILSATPFAGRSSAKADLSVSAGMMHTDSADLVTLFYQHPNVKAALSGHTHLLDRVDYNGVAYLCNGAVSGTGGKATRTTRPKLGTL